MTTEKDDIELFQSEIVNEREFEGAHARIFANGIYHLKIPRDKKVNLAFIDKGYDFVRDSGNGIYHNIWQFASFSDIEPEVREWAADRTKNNHTHSDAIVIKNLSQKLIANFYLKFNQPGKPTKIFYSLENAIEWTLEQIEKKRTN